MRQFIKFILLSPFIIFPCLMDGQHPPPANLLYVNVGGVPTPVTSDLTSGQLVSPPPSILAKCKNGVLIVDCDFSGGGGGSTAFSAITSGTNTGEGLVVGSGSVLTISAGGFINANEINGVALSGLATGILKNTTTTGVPTIAVAGTDYLAPTGSGTGLTGVGILANPLSQFASTTSAQLAGVISNETGTGALVFATAPTMTLPNATGLPLTTGVTGILSVLNGGTGTTTPSLVGGTNVTITGTWPNQTINSTGGGGTTLPGNVPRDTNVRDLFVNVNQNNFVYLGSNYDNLTTVSYNGTLDALGYDYATQTTGTTADTEVGWPSSVADILATANPSFRVIGFLSTASNVNSWVAMCRSCTVTQVDPGTNFNSAVGFRHFSGTEATNWTCYSSDSSSGVAGTTMDSGVAVSTTQAQIFDVVYVSGFPQFYINKTRVCSSFATTHLPDNEVGLLMIAENTTTASLVISMSRMYVGSN